MTRAILGAALVWAIVTTNSVRPAGAVLAAAQDGDPQIQTLLQRIEKLLQAGDSAGYSALIASTADVLRADEFAAFEFRSGATRAVIKERGREELPAALPGDSYRVTVEAFTEFGDRGRIATWQLDLTKADETEWRVAAQARLAAIENLHRLSVDPTKQFDIRDFTIRAEDLDLTLAEGSVFVIDTEQGLTGLILIGRGDLRFHPESETEKGQVRLFAGAETLESRFDTAYVRVGTGNLRANLDQLVPRPVDPRELRRAEQVFREESAKSFIVDISDLSSDTWSLLPGSSDFLAEVHTRRFDTLTYTRSSNEPEDIMVFDREKQKRIASYASPEKLASRGRFYNEDDQADYDILDHDIDLVFDPERQWIEGQSTLRLQIRSSFTNQLTIRLADSLDVHSVVSDEFGWLFSLRVKNQNTVLVNLPVGATRDTDITLRMAYSGRLSPQAPDRETVQVEQDQPPQLRSGLPPDIPRFPPLEPKYLYSSRSYWYPQAPRSDYATATLRISVPAALSCVASGVLSEDSPTIMPGAESSQDRKVYLFTATRPVRYLAFLVSRFTRMEQLTVAFGDVPGRDAAGASAAAPAGATSAEAARGLDLTVEVNPRQTFRGREYATQAADIARFYDSIIGDAPYESFTVALVENTLPGGHSPGYFAMLNQPDLEEPITWRDDPASFEGYPEFFLAHELAHQWWGQAVGWGNYHEQWLSEGFAQYFAALYAQHHRGERAFVDVLRHLRRWSLDQSRQGPVYLGYRLGHLRSDSRVFRAVVYNKGAAVLHMLRRLMGDEAFFRGLRRFYTESRFRKVITDDLRVAMEKEAGRPLDRFFERWIYGSTLPRLTYSYRVESTPEGQAVALHFEQTGEIFDVPITVTLQYANRRPVDVLIPINDRRVDARVPLEGPLRSVDISRDDGTLAEVSKAP